MKKISKTKQIKREENIKEAKKQKLILILSTIPAFISAIASIIVYAIERHAPTWLLAVTSAAWLLLGGLFIFALKKRWGFVTPKGVECRESRSIVTVYNVVLVFALGAFFLAMLIKQLLT